MRFFAPMMCTLPLALACDGSSPSGSGDPGRTTASLEPGLAAACEAVYAECLGAGGDELSCKERYVACVDAGTVDGDGDGQVDDGPGDGHDGTGGDCPAPLDPWAQCKADVVSCIDQGVELDLCLDKMRGCLSLVCGTVDPGGDPGGWDGGDPCAPKLDECLRAGEDPMLCKERYEECAGWGNQGGGGDPGGGDPCGQVFQDCLQYGGGELECKERYNACAGWGNPGGGDPGNGDPCQPKLDECLNAGLPVEDCRQRYEECVGWVGGGEVPPDVEVPADPCWPVYEGCVQAGEPPEACKERYNQCAGWNSGWDGGGEVPPEPAAESPCDAAFRACAALVTSDAEVVACKAGYEACLGATGGTY